MEFIRVPVQKRLAAIYYRHGSHEVKPKIREDFKYGGVYDRRNDVIYDLQYQLRILLGISTEEYTNSKEAITTVAQTRIREIVDATICNDCNNLQIKSMEEITDKSLLDDYEYHRSYNAAKEARQLFMLGDAPEDVEVCCDYDGAHMPDEDMLDWIIDSEEYCKRKAAEYLDTEQESLYIRFYKSYLTQTELENIFGNVNHEAHTVKAIMDALNSRSCQTVMVTVSIDGKELTFKTGTGSLSSDPEGSSYSTYQIFAQDRKLFEETFGRNAGYHPKDIVKICYGRVAIYEKQAGGAE